MVIKMIVWTEEKVLSLLRKLDIRRYTVDHEAKVISLYDISDLFKVMNEVGVNELSESCRMSMMKWKNKICMHVGEWQFEAEDTRK
jgi:hypothetical protein